VESWETHIKLLEIKTTVSEVKIALGGINGRLEIEEK
jgi:hypothetical protein